MLWLVYHNAITHFLVCVRNPLVGILSFIILANNSLLPHFDVLPIGFKADVVEIASQRPYTNCIGIAHMVVCKVAHITKQAYCTEYTILLVAIG
jgi:hypothetical protein